MPLQNRVDPFGNLFRSTARGTMMGNCGGQIHNDSREIVRRSASRRWIACVLEFRGRHRIVMSEHRYTELFFLDEAVALAAGHRPCAECRHERFTAFKEAWRMRQSQTAPVYADDMDRELHRERINRQRNKVTYEAPLGSLPDGCFIQRGENAYLLWDDALLLWTPESYARRDRRDGNELVRVLTPRSIVECFRQGYRPAVHESALAVS